MGGGRRLKKKDSDGPLCQAKLGRRRRKGESEVD